MSTISSPVIDVSGKMTSFVFQMTTRNSNCLGTRGVMSVGSPGGDPNSTGNMSTHIWRRPCKQQAFMRSLDVEMSVTDHYLFDSRLDLVEKRTSFYVFRHQVQQLQHMQGQPLSGRTPVQVHGDVLFWSSHTQTIKSIFQNLWSNFWQTKFLEPVNFLLLDSSQTQHIIAYKHRLVQVSFFADSFQDFCRKLAISPLVDTITRTWLVKIKLISTNHSIAMRYIHMQ